MELTLERLTKQYGNKIAVDRVDMKFGTGLMKVTPAHDPNDYILGKKYNYPNYKEHKARHDEFTMKEKIFHF